ncbi:MAG: c-type cytochrome [Burkholderiaceae bacterium]
MFRSGKSGRPARAVLLAIAGAVVAVLVGCVSAGRETGAGGSTAAENARPWAGIGRIATPAEIAAWDIDVRADFKGLPKGSGSVDRGMDVWEAKCASCHGTFGESNEVFTPIVGGTTKQDIVTGRVANLARPDFPQRTTLMKVSQISTLWDYINRAMPWNAPKSLTVEEVYAVTAYILHLGDIVPSDFVLSDANMAQVQARLPNRNGMVRFEGLWSVSGTPDVKAVACMKDCALDKGVDSALPDHARNAHGQLAAQHRVIGPVRGADTDQPAGERAAQLARAAAVASVAGSTPRTEGHAAALPQGAAAAGQDAASLARETGCLACHALDGKLVGPGLREVAARYKDKPDSLALLTTRVRSGGQGVWGPIPMPPQAQLSESQAQDLVRWILAGAR